MLLKTILRCFLIVLIFGSIANCKKYPDDPFISSYPNLFGHNLQLTIYRINGIDCLNSLKKPQYSGPEIALQFYSKPSIKGEPPRGLVSGTDDGEFSYSFDNSEDHITFYSSHNFPKAPTDILLFQGSTNSYTIREWFNKTFKITTTIGPDYYELIFKVTN